MLQPAKLRQGDEIRVIAPARSLAIISEQIKDSAKNRLNKLGLSVTFGKNVLEKDAFNSSSIASRVADLHDAFGDNNVKAVITVLGGFNCNQLLRYIDYDLISRNPKIFCGYSDITALSNAINHKTGLITYSGIHFSTLGVEINGEYSEEYFYKCLFNESPITVVPCENWSDDDWFLDQQNRTLKNNEGWWVINEGEVEGEIAGGNLCTFNLLQGTEFMPDLTDKILFLEDDYEAMPHHFDRDLQSLIHQPGFDKVRGIIIGRFESKSGVTRNLLEKIIHTKSELNNLPVLANVDFGHTQPMITFPIGGTVKLKVKFTEQNIEILIH